MGAAELYVSTDTMQRCTSSLSAIATGATLGATLHPDHSRKIRSHIVPGVPNGWPHLEEIGRAAGRSKQTMLDWLQLRKVHALHAMAGGQSEK